MSARKGKWFIGTASLILRPNSGPLMLSAFLLLHVPACFLALHPGASFLFSVFELSLSLLLYIGLALNVCFGGGSRLFRASTALFLLTYIVCGALLVLDFMRNAD